MRFLKGLKENELAVRNREGIPVENTFVEMKHGEALQYIQERFTADRRDLKKSKKKAYEKNKKRKSVSSKKESKKKRRKIDSDSESD